jgi:hypothetical protein
MSLASAALCATFALSRSEVTLLSVKQRNNHVFAQANAAEERMGHCVQHSQQQRAQTERLVSALNTLPSVVRAVEQTQRHLSRFSSSISIDIDIYV